jgi:hypothetical protein
VQGNDGAPQAQPFQLQTETHPMNAILTADQLREIAPSIFALSPWDRVSTNYRLVPTSEVLGMMQDQ